MNKEIYIHALKLSGKKFYTSFELTEKLRKKFPEAISEIPLVIKTLEAEGFLNDFRYMENFVASAFAHRTWSLRMLRNKLLRRGIDATLLQKYLSDTSHYDERMILERIFDKTFSTSPSETEILKFIQSMERKGFFLSTVLAVARGSDR